MKRFNLGYKGPDYGTASPVSAPEVPEQKTYYPSIYISDAPHELLKMADQGEATITFKVVNKQMNENLREGKKTCQIELEIQSITPKGTSGMIEESKDTSGEAIDEYFDN